MHTLPIRWGSIRLTREWVMIESKIWYLRIIFNLEDSEYFVIERIYISSWGFESAVCGLKVLYRVRQRRLYCFRKYLVTVVMRAVRWRSLGGLTEQRRYPNFMEAWRFHSRSSWMRHSRYLTWRNQHFFRHCILYIFLRTEILCKFSSLPYRFYLKIKGSYTFVLSLLYDII